LVLLEPSRNLAGALKHAMGTELLRGRNKWCKHDLDSIS